MVLCSNGYARRHNTLTFWFGNIQVVYYTRVMILGNPSPSNHNLKLKCVYLCGFGSLVHVV